MAAPGRQASAFVAIESMFAESQGRAPLFWKRLVRNLRSQLDDLHINLDNDSLSTMRNIFDQYKSPENRLTHALACCLDRDRRLLRAFVTCVTGRRNLDWASLEIVEQQIPGGPTSAPENGETGLPDMWIYGDGDWALVIESKVQAKILIGQLRRHEKSARQNGFNDIDLVVLAPSVPKHQAKDIEYLTWSKVYSWLRKQAPKSEWAVCAAEYFEVAEARMIEDGYLTDGSLTEFDGIPFGHDRPYSYREAKRLLKLAFDKLRKRDDLVKLGMDPNGAGRPAIKGRAENFVWDFLPLKAARRAESPTATPHLTLAIQEHRALVIVPLPNSARISSRKELERLSLVGFRDLVRRIECDVSKAIRPFEDAYPYIEAVQRHFHPRNKPIEDARLEFDLRTSGGASGSRVKVQPEWLEAAYGVMLSSNSNFQIGIGAVFPYGNSRLHTCDVLDAIASTWIACRPWIDAALGK
ncbi:MAG TPA: hypothetical protein PKN33_03790 [Phycisphaerae bacterium]|nr:hypothetical protein [Phycisphaerae bacterium]